MDALAEETLAKAETLTLDNPDRAVLVEASEALAEIVSDLEDFVWRKIAFPKAKITPKKVTKIIKRKQ